MGWWSPDIMGGDTPYDVRGNFEDLFGVKDPDDWYSDKPAPKYRAPTSKESVEFINSFPDRRWFGGEDMPIVKQVTGFLHMERGGAMSDELRALILEGIDEEIATGCEDWNDPQERIDSLKDFRTRVEAYPAAGGTVDLPHQRGLFDMMAEKIVIPGNSNTK